MATNKHGKDSSKVSLTNGNGNGRGRAVIITAMVIAAMVPTFTSIATYIEARAASITVEKVHVAVNSKSDVLLDQNKLLVAANKELTQKIGILEERLTPRIPVQNVGTTTLTDEQFQRLLKGTKP